MATLGINTAPAHKNQYVMFIQPPIRSLKLAFQFSPNNRAQYAKAMMKLTIKNTIKNIKTAICKYFFFTIFLPFLEIEFAVLCHDDC